MIFVSMTLLVFFLAVAMGVDDQKEKDNHSGNKQNHHDRLILPYQVNKIG
jgi:hypothetical protein